MSKTIISAGGVIRAMLLESEAVAAITTKVYPIVEETKATLPYISYRRTALAETQMRGSGAISAVFEVVAWARNYPESVALGEAIVEALDRRRAATDELTVRSCILTDSDEGWTSDAYYQRFKFKLSL